MPQRTIASTIHLVPARNNSETAGVLLLAPVPLGSMDGVVGVWYANMAKANGMMCFRWEELELFNGYQSGVTDKLPKQVHAQFLPLGASEDTTCIAAPWSSCPRGNGKAGWRDGCEGMGYEGGRGSEVIPGLGTGDVC